MVVWCGGVMISEIQCCIHMSGGSVIHSWDKIGCCKEVGTASSVFGQLLSSQSPLCGGLVWWCDDQWHPVLYLHEWWLRDTQPLWPPLHHSLPFSSSVFPATSLGYTIFGEIFAYWGFPTKRVYHAWDIPFCSGTLDIWSFFTPTIEVVTFHFSGWCILDVFLLPAFTFLIHECPDLLGLCDECMCVQTGSWFILSSDRVTGNGVKSHVNSKGEIRSARGSEEGQTCDAALYRTASTAHYWLCFFGPKVCHQIAISPFCHGVLTLFPFQNVRYTDGDCTYCEMLIVQVG